MGSSHELLYLHLSERAVLCGSGAGRVLNECVGFRSLEDHLARLQEKGLVRAQHRDAALRELNLLRRHGAFVSAEGLIDRCREAAAGCRTSSPARIECLCLPTCSRPDLLARAIESYAANLADFGRQIEIVVSDNSEHVQRQQECKESVRHLSRRLRIQAVYAGAPEKSAFARKLAAEGVPEETADFALYGLGPGVPRMGANRNAILLHTTGRMFLSVDDDTVCAPAVLAVSSALRARLCGDAESAELWFRPSRSDAIASVREIRLDIVGAHEAFLGKSLASVISSITDQGVGPLDMDEICPHLVLAMHHGKGNVGLTASGVYGDSGMHSGPVHHLWPRRETYERMVESERSYHTALASREVVRQAPVLSVAHGGPCASMFWALDNREPLPPFLPSFRAEDTLFGFFLQRTRDDFYYAHLGNGRSCNLACPSCRTGLHIDTPAQEAAGQIYTRLCHEALPYARRIRLSGAGELFASRACRNLMSKLTREGFPRLRFEIVTSGQLFDRQAYDEFDLAGRGGDFERLLRNIAFAASLRKFEAQSFRLNFGFVVSALNFREMPAFVDFAAQYDATVTFQRIRNWGHLSPPEFGAINAAD